MCLMVGRMMGMELCSSRRLLSDEESLVWWLHASDAWWARNCYVPISCYWARSP